MGPDELLLNGSDNSLTHVWQSIKILFIFNTMIQVEVKVSNISSLFELWVWLLTKFLKRSNTSRNKCWLHLIISCRCLVIVHFKVIYLKACSSSTWTPLNSFYLNMSGSNRNAADLSLSVDWRRAVSDKEPWTWECARICIIKQISYQLRNKTLLRHDLTVFTESGEVELKEELLYVVRIINIERGLCCFITRAGVSHLHTGSTLNGEIALNTKC